MELVWTHLSHNTLISQPKVLTFTGSVSPMVSLVYTTVSCLFLQHLVWHEEVKNSRILIGFLILAWQLMTPTLGGPIDKAFFARINSTVQAALSSSAHAYIILDVVSCL